VSDKAELLLRARGIRAGYGGCEVLCGVDVDIFPGEVLCVAGPNGSGKSTLLRAVTGLIPLYGGEVRMDGTSLADLSAMERARRCAVQPQVEAPLFDYTVGQFVQLGRHPHQRPLAPASTEDHAFVSRALEQTDLSGFGQRSIRSLSAGEWQRALLARTLTQQAPLLLLDEPAAHLDPGHCFAMHSLLRRLAREENRAILCVSHDLNLAAGFSDRMMIMSNGSVAAVGSPEEVMTESNLRAAFHCDALRVGTNPFTGRPGTFFAS